MASVLKRGRVWYVQYRSAAGVRTRERTAARSREEAKRIAAELELKHERISRGLEVEPGDPTLTFGKLFEWWWNTHGVQLSSTTIGGKGHSLRKHVLPPLRDLVLREVTPARLERLFDEMGRELAASTVNTLRAQLRAIFGRAKSRGLWLGENPAAATERRKETRKEFDELSVDEVPVLLRELDARWRPLFATAIFTGMRKGELCALRRDDVDLEAGLIHIGRSWSSDTTKGGTTKSVPIAAALRPYLETALEAKGSHLVFPGADGEMMRSDVKLAPVLRRALARAGLTRGWLHVCRRRGKTPCDFSEKRDHNRAEPCPKCGFRLWPKPLYREIRFHDTRATTATLLARSGASPAVAQRVLRHADPSLTLKVYTRVRSEEMLAALDAMVPSMNPSQTSAVAPEAAQLPAAVNGSAEGPSEPQASPRAEIGRPTGQETVARLGTSTERPRHDSNVLPRPSEYSPGSENGGASRALALNSAPSQAVATRGVRGDARGAAPFTSRRGPAEPQLSREALARAAASTEAHKKDPDSIRTSDRPSIARSFAVAAPFLSVRQVAEQLAVSTATVYALCDRGELEHVRVSNAIRVSPAALERYLGRGAAMSKVTPTVSGSINRAARRAAEQALARKLAADFGVTFSLAFKAVRAGVHERCAELAFDLASENPGRLGSRTRGFIAAVQALAGPRPSQHDLNPRPLSHQLSQLTRRKGAP